MEKLFNKVLILIFYFFSYRGYYKKYNISKEFKFNGYLIRLYGDGKITTGKNSYISFYSYINCQKGTSLTIGNDVQISHNVRIYTTTINSDDFILENKQTTIKGDITIGNNILIGANVFINPGVNIGDNVIIGANSVITKDIEPNCIAGGIPCKVIKKY